MLVFMFRVLYSCSYVLLALAELPLRTLVMDRNPWDTSVVDNKVVIYTPIVVFALAHLKALDGGEVSEALRECVAAVVPGVRPCRRVVCLLVRVCCLASATAQQLWVLEVTTTPLVMLS